MWRRYRTLLLLLGLSAGLFGYLSLYERKQPSREEARQEAERLVTAAMLPAAAPDGGAAQPALRQVVIHVRRPGKPPATAPVIDEISLRRYEVAGRPEWWLDSPHVRADD